jgi:hypothetical protein
MNLEFVFHVFRGYLNAYIWSMIIIQIWSALTVECSWFFSSEALQIANFHELGGSRRPRRLIDLESESFAEDGERHLILQDILAAPLQLQGWI